MNTTEWAKNPQTNAPRSITEPAAPEPLGDSEGTATQVVAGLEPVAEISDCGIPVFFKEVPSGESLYSAADVAKLQADLAAMTKKADGFFDALQLAAKINAEGQAREQQLREALYDLWTKGEDCGGITMALALPQDDTALRQWGAKLLREVAKGGCTHVHVLRKADELEAGK